MEVDTAPSTPQKGKNDQITTTTTKTTTLTTTTSTTSIVKELLLKKQNFHCFHVVRCIKISWWRLYTKYSKSNEEDVTFYRCGLLNWIENQNETSDEDESIDMEQVCDSDDNIDITKQSKKSKKNKKNIIRYKYHGDNHFMRHQNYEERLQVNHTGLDRFKHLKRLTIDPLSSSTNDILAQVQKRPNQARPDIGKYVKISKGKKYEGRLTPNDLKLVGFTDSIKRCVKLNKLQEITKKLYATPIQIILYEFILKLRKISANMSDEVIKALEYIDVEPKDRDIKKVKIEIMKRLTELNIRKIISQEFWKKIGGGDDLEENFENVDKSLVKHAWQWHAIKLPKNHPIMRRRRNKRLKKQLLKSQPRITAFFTRDEDDDDIDNNTNLKHMDSRPIVSISDLDTDNDDDDDDEKII